MVVQDKAITLGHPSYVWRFGQERRLELVRRHVELQDQRILDIGAGIGTYVRQFRRFSAQVYGVDVDEEKVGQARATLSGFSVAPAEYLPFADDSFDVTFLHEVIEHVEDDRAAIREAYRVTRPGGSIVIYAPNRLYFFETHGFYLGKRYIFGLCPLINYLPDRLRQVFAPHVRCYRTRDLSRLFDGLPSDVVVHSYVYPGFDNIVARYHTLGGALRGLLYRAEQTPLRVFGLSHFLVVRKRAPDRLDYQAGARLTAERALGPEVKEPAARQQA